MEKKAIDLKVFQSYKEGTCFECGEYVGLNDLITLDVQNNPICSYCSDLDHLVYLPAGDAALSRRSKKYSTVSAIVYKFSKARKRNERQGILVTEEALSRAEDECLQDEEIRMKRRLADRKRRDSLDKKYIQKFTDVIHHFYPSCPTDEAIHIANHACEKYSGRVGRSAAAKEFDEQMITLAVRAHIRHVHTHYDSLLQSYLREEARNQIKDLVDEIEMRWKVNNSI